MAKGRELKGRIKSVENTRKITRTMEMVATSKMKRAQDRVVAARPYAQRAARRDREPLLAGARRALPAAAPAGAGRSARRVILLTANRGLAGAFNANLIKEARAHDRRVSRATGVAGRPARRSARRGSATSSTSAATLASQRIDISDRPTAENAAEIVERADGDVRRRRARRACTWSTRSSTRRCRTPPTTEQVLPVTPPEDEGGDAARLPPLSRSPRRSSPSCFRCTCATRCIARWSRRRRRSSSGAAHRDEERNGQRGRHAQRSSPYLQPRPSGADHAGDRRDRRRRCGTPGIIHGNRDRRRKQIGKVVQVIGPVLDVEFESEHLPELYNALEINATHRTPVRRST